MGTRAQNSALGSPNAEGSARSAAVFVATLFDFNGVLVDDEAVHLAAFRDVLEPLGVSIAETDYWERYIGFDDVGAFRAMLADAGKPASDAEVRELVERKRPSYMQRARQGLRAFPSASEVVRDSARRGPVGIVSGALRDEVELGLDLLGVRDQVRFVVSAEDTTRCKPDPEGYLTALGHLGRPDPGRVLVIEDSIAGVVAAKAAGLVCLAVAHSHPADLLRNAGADSVLETIAAIDATIVEALGHRSHARPT